MFRYNLQTVQQGTVGLASAIFWYQRLGYNVLLPLVDNADYDLVLEQRNKFYTVQVKTTKQKRSSNFVVQMKKVRTNKHVNRLIPMAVCDLVFILTEDGTSYSIPFNLISVKHTLTLTKKLDIYKIGIANPIGDGTSPEN